MEQSFIRYISCKYFSPSLCLVFLFLWSKCIALQMILVIHQACDVFLNCCLYIALSFARLGAMHSPQFSITHFSLCRSRLSHSQLLWLYLFFVSPFKFQLLEWIPLYLPVAGPFWFWYHLYSRFPSCLPFMVQKHMVWLSWSVRLMMLPPPPPHCPLFLFFKISVMLIIYKMRSIFLLNVYFSFICQFFFLSLFNSHKSSIFIWFLPFYCIYLNKCPFTFHVPE